MKIDFLKSKAEDFLKTTEYHFKEKMYHLVAFDLEQALQLFLKYTLFLKTRTYPPIHSIKELLKGAGRIYKKEKEIQKITDKKGQVYRNKLISLNNFKQSPVSYPSFNSFPQY